MKSFSWIGYFVASVLCLLIVLSLVRINELSFLDGTQGVVLGLLLGEDTVYTAGYTETGWKKVTLRMTVDQVHKLLGPPQLRWELNNLNNINAFGERWSFSPGDTNFRCRVLLFSNGLVYKKHQEFYLD